MKSNQSRPTKTYRKRPPEVWLAIRAAWERGGDVRDLARRYDVSVESIRWRAKNHGWTRQPPTLAVAAWTEQAPPAALRIAETGLAHALTALAAGRSAEALAAIKAADAVGAFADFVANLRAKREPAKTAEPEAAG